MYTEKHLIELFNDHDYIQVILHSVLYNKKKFGYKRWSGFPEEDKVPHKRLLNKLNYYGIRSNTLQWIYSFLHDRKQLVLLEGCSVFVTFFKYRYYVCL
jgi:hypothetical protein